jgi:hypothetical protein
MSHLTCRWPETFGVPLYGRAVILGVTRSRCFLRRPALIMATWATLGGLDAAWFFVAGQRLPF